MIVKDKVLVVDIDGTLCPIKRAGDDYRQLQPEPRLLARLREMHGAGWRIILSTARGMRTHDGNAGEIAKSVLPVLLDWLAEHDVPYDELWTAKPWPGHQGFYIDDRTVRPREFLENDLAGLQALMARDRVAQ